MSLIPESFVYAPLTATAGMTVPPFKIAYLISPPMTLMSVSGTAEYTKPRSMGTTGKPNWTWILGRGRYEGRLFPGDKSVQNLLLLLILAPVSSMPASKPGTRPPRGSAGDRGT